MSRIDDVIEDVAYILDSLIALRNIDRVGRNCNTCKDKLKCEWSPEPGQYVRFNCPHYRGEANDENKVDGA